MQTNDSKKTIKIVQLAILFALVIVLQSIASFGVVNICLCLIPITLGATLLGPKSGAALGFMFGVLALFWGIVGKDVFTYYLFTANPVMTIIICIAKGTLCGFVPGIVYKALKNKNELVGSIVASVLAPIVNTGVFALGCLIIKNDVVNVTLSLIPTADASNFFLLLFGTLITVNFFVEFIVNVVFSPVLYKLTSIINKRINA
ncbi:MAG: ECF transporter S component [Clostridia bacterium]|nr:ECF transporter S component [Clostridia bacterium]